MIRIANGQGFWGDWLEAPVRLVEQGPIDYLALDYLAEITMSILQKQRQADPRLGYARDFPPLIGPHRAPDPRARRQGDRQRRRRESGGLRARSAARGAGPQGRGGAGRRCVPAPRRVSRQGLRDARHGYRRADRRHSRPHPQRQRLYRRVSAGRGAGNRRRRGDRRPLHRYRAHAGAHGPPLRLASRTSTTSWPPAPSPATSSNAARSRPAATARWTGRPFPTWRISAIRSWKPSPTARSSSPSTPAPAGASAATRVKEQLLYELGDPRRYITPDCVADFTSIRLADAGPDRVRVSGIRGGPRPPSLKLSISYANGWKAIGTLVYSLAAGARKSARRRPHRAPAPARTGPRVRRNLHRVFRRERLPRPGRAAQSRPAGGAVAHRRARAGPQGASTASRAS